MLGLIGTSQNLAIASLLAVAGAQATIAIALATHMVGTPTGGVSTHTCGYWKYCCDYECPMNDQGTMTPNGESEVGNLKTISPIVAFNFYSNLINYLYNIA